MKINCETIKDLIPLCVDGIASEESKKIVEEHIASCESCKSAYESESEPLIDKAEAETAPLKKIKKAMEKRKTLTVLLSVCITLVIAFIAAAFITSPDYASCAQSEIVLTEKANGLITVSFGENVTDCEITSYEDENGSGLYVNITSWDSIYGRYISRTKLNEIVLNPNGEKISCVYYYSADGADDIPLYGQADGHAKTLPRLVLNYYFLLALIMAAVCGILMFLTRRNERAFTVIKNIMLIFVSYLLAHLAIKGYDAASYSQVRDLWLILLAAAAIYGALYALVKLFTVKAEKQSIPRR